MLLYTYDSYNYFKNIYIYISFFLSGFLFHTIILRFISFFMMFFPFITYHPHQNKLITILSSNKLRSDRVAYTKDLRVEPTSIDGNGALIEYSGRSPLIEYYGMS